MPPCALFRVRVDIRVNSCLRIGLLHRGQESGRKDGIGPKAGSWRLVLTRNNPEYSRIKVTKRSKARDIQ